MGQEEKFIDGEKILAKFCLVLLFCCLVLGVGCIVLHEMRYAVIEEVENLSVEKEFLEQKVYDLEEELMECEHRYINSFRRP